MSGPSSASWFSGRSPAPAAPAGPPGRLVAHRAGHPARRIQRSRSGSQTNSTSASGTRDGQQRDGQRQVADDLLLLAAGVGERPGRVGRAGERLGQLVADQRHPAHLAAASARLSAMPVPALCSFWPGTPSFEHHVVQPDAGADPGVHPDHHERCR
jgi:hypothetical protein